MRKTGMEIINNCSESKWYYEKGCRQRKTGRILLICGGSCILIGGITEAFATGFKRGNYFVPIAGVGAATMLTSIPFFVSGKHKKDNAYQVYNEYCAKPTASLSFGPATKGIGMGVYLNF